MKAIFRIVLVVFILINICFFTDEAYAAINDVWVQGNSFLNTGSEPLATINMTAASEGIKEIADFLWGIGLLVIFISTMVLGMKYMLVLPDEKSRIKQATTPYIIGVIIIFGAVTIWKIIINILEGSLGIGG